MGLLRVMLALTVMLDHMHGINGYALIGGPLAVQCFFVISGFYMGLVLNERYDRPGLNRAFYANRALRIYVNYFIALVLTIVVTAYVARRLGQSVVPNFLDPTLTLGSRLVLGLVNLSVVGQDLAVWFRIDHRQLAPVLAFNGNDPQAAFHYMAIAPAWSLALELCFYAIAPFIARRSVGQVALLMGLSLAARAICAMVGWSADPFSFRFFPFELALFLGGVLAYRAWARFPEVWHRPQARLLALAVPVVMVIYPWLLAGWSPDVFFSPARIGLLVLLGFALPAIHAWSCHSARDRAIGELSYPIYLVHMLVLCVISGIDTLSARPVPHALVAAADCVALAWLMTRFADAPLEALRRRIARKAGAAEHLRSHDRLALQGPGA